MFACCHRDVSSTSGSETSSRFADFRYVSPAGSGLGVAQADVRVVLILVAATPPPIAGCETARTRDVAAAIVPRTRLMRAPPVAGTADGRRRGATRSPITCTNKST